MERRTKVLHTLFRVGSGGVEQTRLTLARGLDADRYEQRILCMDAFGALPDRLAASGCRVDVVGNGFSIFKPQVYRDVLRVIRQWQPDIVHGAVYEGVAMAAVAGRAGRVRAVIGEETSEPVGRSKAGHALFQMLCGLTDQMVAVSPAIAQYLVGRLQLPASKVSMVPNGVASPAAGSVDATTMIRKRHGIAADSFVVGTVGRLEDAHKRVSDLIRAMQMVRDVIPDPRLMVVGDGEDADMLRALAASLGVGDIVHFCGYQADTADHYRVMDVFALASAHEAFGLVLVEAMQLGLPVVATRVGGIPTVVDDGVTGLLVASMAPQALAKAILRLHGDPELRAQLGSRGRTRAEALFGADTYVEAIDRLYSHCLADARR